VIALGDFMNQTLEFIFKRRSIRKFESKLIEPEKITLMLQAAMAAPTATNSKPWEFVVLTEQKQISEVRSALMFAKFDAPLVVCVCGNTNGVAQLVKERFWVQDCSAATENLLLAVTALDLGAVWCGVHPISAHQKRLTKILNLPPGVLPLNAIFIGYPAEEKPARTQYDPTRVHWQTYGKKQASKDSVE
jgi:nitroreductase